MMVLVILPSCDQDIGFKWCIKKISNQSINGTSIRKYCAVRNSYVGCTCIVWLNIDHYREFWWKTWCHLTSFLSFLHNFEKKTSNYFRNVTCITKRAFQDTQHKLLALNLGLRLRLLASNSCYLEKLLAIMHH